MQKEARNALVSTGIENISLFKGQTNNKLQLLKFPTLESVTHALN